MKSNQSKQIEQAVQLIDDIALRSRPPFCPKCHCELGYNRFYTSKIREVLEQLLLPPQIITESERMEAELEPRPQEKKLSMKDSIKHIPGPKTPL